MTKDKILTEIKLTAAKNGGKPLGQERFAKETGIQISDWHGKFWIRWSQALSEAGFEPNKYQSSYSDDFVLEKLALLTRELKHFPVKPEIKMKAHADKTFPSHSVFDRVGRKNVLINRLFEFVALKAEFNDIYEILKIENDRIEIADSQEDNISAKGYVYLVKHGSRNEYKIGRTNNPIRREGELTIELPEKLLPIHWIETDDPSGIEKYWHSRFSEKRKNGEWFSLSSEDVKAFKRWRKIF